MRCQQCGQDISTCDHTANLSIRDLVEEASSIDDATEEFPLEISSSEVEDVTSQEHDICDDPTLYLNPELPSVSFSKEEAIGEARHRVLQKLKAMGGREVVEAAIKGMLREELLGLSLEGVEFPDFLYEVELPLQGIVFSVKVVEEAPP